MLRPLRPRRFAPLDPAKKSAVDGSRGDGVRVLKGVVFDVDGTLCEPQTYMFAEMRAALAIPKTIDILDHIYALPTPSEQDAAQEKIRAIERTAMATQTPQPGLATLMTYLDARYMAKAICTRNFDAPVTHLLTTFLPGSAFAPIITREFRPPKPHPAGILKIAETWGVDARDLIMVGDSVDDMTAGYRAGAATVLLVNDVNTHLVAHEHTDCVIASLEELEAVLEGGFEGRGEEGKD